MKFTIKKADLVVALAFADAATAQTSVQQVLSHVEISASDNAVTLSGCNGEMFARRTVSTFVEQPGSITVGSKVLGKVLKTVRADEITIEDDLRHYLKLRAGRQEFTLYGASADNFPELPLEPHGIVGEMTIDGATLANSLRGVLYAASTDPLKFFLQGVYFERDDDSIMLISTDSRRMAYRRLEHDDASYHGHAETIIPANCLFPIARHRFADDNVKMFVSESRVWFWLGSDRCMISSSLIDGRFPDWHAVIPSPNRYQLEYSVDRLEFARAVKSLKSLLTKDTPQIRMEFNGNTVQLHTHATPFGMCVDPVRLKIINSEVQSMSIGINFRYLSDTLETLENSRILLRLTTPTSALVLADDHCTGCVIMPMRLDESATEPAEEIESGDHVAEEFIESDDTDGFTVRELSPVEIAA